MGEGCFWGESEVIGLEREFGTIVEIFGCIMYCDCMGIYDAMCNNIDL